MGLYGDCPCKECKPPKRQPLCHSKCEEKLAWDREKADIMATIQREKDKDYHATGFIVDSQRRTAKRIGKKG